MNKDSNLRKTFNEEAELYDLVRPHYPKKLFDSIVEVAQLKEKAKLLEIGPGTGQATESFAERGYEIVAVELGSALAEVARKKFKNNKKVEVITGAFEEVELPKASFDLVYSATAFHWVHPDVKFNKPHQLLKDGGSLAIIDTRHVSDEKGDEFFFATQPIYKKYKPGGNYDDSLRLSQTSKLKEDEFDETLFKPIFFSTFPLVVKYSAKKYAQLLDTYSPTISMKPKQRQGFLDEIERLIEDKFNGQINKHFAMTLTIAKKK